MNDALKAMIDIDYTHRNLKPENILIKYNDNNKNNFDIKLTDFGIYQLINSILQIIYIQKLGIKIIWLLK